MLHIKYDIQYNIVKNIYNNWGYDQKGRVGAKWLNLKSEINLYRFILGCNAAKKKQTGQN